MKATIRAAVVLAVLAPLPLSATGRAHAGLLQETCRGAAVTHVGAPGETVQGTDGADVVLTNGAFQVLTGAGDDIICATGRRDPVSVRPGPGDDVVDTTAFRGTAFGATFISGPGDEDLYVGSPIRDSVVLKGRDADGAVLRMTGGPGGDSLLVTRSYVGTAEADLGAGNDEAWVRDRMAGARLDAGRGRDELGAGCTDCASVTVSLEEGTLAYPGWTAGATGFEDVEVDGGYGTLPPRTVVVRGSDSANRIDVESCTVSVRGRGGDDRLRQLRYAHRSCDTASYDLRGGAGDDLLRGSYGDDVLLGGAGTDTSVGRLGHDRCRTETEKSCES